MLANEKKLLSNSETKHIKVSHFPELKLENIYYKALQKPGMADYFPSSYGKNKSSDRGYFWVVYNHLYPQDVKNLLDHANKIRFSLLNDKLKKDSVLLHDIWKERLSDSMNFKPRRIGKMSSLLK